MTQIPRPEHPQPQMKREHWKNLNGEWDFSFDFGCSGIDQKWQEGKTDWEKKILVPFCPESDLSGIGYKDFIPGVWYHRTITLTGEELKGDLLLHFGAVDYDARVWINGVEAGRHQGGYVSFTFNITKLVKEGENDITLFAADDVRGGKQPRESRVISSTPEAVIIPERQVSGRRYGLSGYRKATLKKCNIIQTWQRQLWELRR